MRLSYRKIIEMTFKNWHFNTRKFFSLLSEILLFSYIRRLCKIFFLIFSLVYNPTKARSHPRFSEAADRVFREFQHVRAAVRKTAQFVKERQTEIGMLNFLTLLV